MGALKEENLWQACHVRPISHSGECAECGDRQVRSLAGKLTGFSRNGEKGREDGYGTLQKRSLPRPFSAFSRLVSAVSALSSGKYNEHMGKRASLKLNIYNFSLDPSYWIVKDILNLTEGNTLALW